MVECILTRLLRSRFCLYSCSTPFFLSVGIGHYRLDGAYIAGTKWEILTLRKIAYVHFRRFELLVRRSRAGRAKRRLRSHAKRQRLIRCISTASIF